MSSLVCHAADSTGKLAGLLSYLGPCICRLVLQGGDLICLPIVSSACVDNIKMVYGEDSAELSNFKRVIKDESNK